MINVARAVNFGASKGSLSTVGFTLKNYDGSIKAARVTSGISEIVIGKGVYGAIISFEDDWSGFIIWDTGEVSPLYSVDQFDWRQYFASAGASGGGGSVILPSFEEDFARINRSLNKIIKALKMLPNHSIAVDQGILKVLESYKVAHREIMEEIKTENPKIKSLIEGMRYIGEALEVIIDKKEFEETIKEIQNAENT